MCRKYPDTPVILDHAGGIRVRNGVLPEDQLQVLRQLAANERTMIKIGPVHGLGEDTNPFRDVLPLIERIVDAFGPQRCMWESDSGGPVMMEDPPWDMAASINLIQEAKFLSQEDKDWILSETAEGFFFNR